MKYFIFNNTSARPPQGEKKNIFYNIVIDYINIYIYEITITNDTWFRMIRLLVVCSLCVCLDLA